MIDFLFNSYKIKYVNMSDLFRKINIENNVETVTLYINMESILTKLHQDRFEETILNMTKPQVNSFTIQFISNLINLAAHYRLYFTRAKVRSNIVFFMNDPSGYKIYNNSVYNEKYRKRYKDIYTDPNFVRINDIIRDGLELFREIICYIDSVYFLTSNRLESSVIPYMAQKHKKLKADLNMILTRDMYDMQYVNHGYLVLYPDKEESVILDKDNVMAYLRHKNDFDEKYEIDINPLLIPFIHSVLGDKKRSLDKIKGIGFKKIYKCLEKLYEKEYLDDSDLNTFNIEHLSEFIKTSNGLFELNVKEIIGNNYFSIDLDRQLNISNSYHNAEILDAIGDMMDSTGLKKLNDRVFSDHPIQIVELNNYYKKSKSDNVFENAFRQFMENK